MLAVQSIIPPESSTGLLKLRGACYHALSGRPGPAPRPLRGALGNVSASSQQLRQTASRGSCARRGSPSPELSWGVFSAAAAPRSPGDSPLALWPQEALPTRPVWEQGPSQAGPDRRGKERDGQPICCPRAPPGHSAGRLSLLPALPRNPRQRAARSPSTGPTSVRPMTRTQRRVPTGRALRHPDPCNRAGWASSLTRRRPGHAGQGT